MITKKVSLDLIRFEECEPGDELLASIARSGIAIPVRVNECEDGYICLDGRKRLTACARLRKKEERFAQVPVMILNDFTKAGSAYWGNTQNKH